MIPEYINNWITVIEEMSNDNTYKLAWGRAIIECITFDNCYKKDNNIIIEFDEISKFILKYYWNQMFFFNLKQAPYRDKIPVICKLTLELINEYKNVTKSTIPLWFDESKIKSVNSSLYYGTIKKISKTLHENVSWRFKNTPNGVIDLYEYEKGISKISFDYNNAILLKEYGIIISKLLNYKWTQLLEKFNYSPKIASKILGISDNTIRRNDLSKYKDELLKEYDGKPIDFYTGLVLKKDDITVDHVIPWSFMYSDDIWNLVLTSKSNNSSKSNSIPSVDVIEKLKKRNEDIKNIVDKKYQLDIEEAINLKLIDKFYYECRL